MRQTWGAAILMTALAACSPAEQATEPADLVLTGGTIYTIDKSDTVAQTMAVRNGEIVYVGDDKGIQRFIGKSTTVQALAGQVVFPGFTDSHAHLPDSGGALLGLNLSGLPNAEAIIAEVKAYADAHPELAVIVGSGWELNFFAGANPTKDLLDAVVADRPVFLVASDGHNGWANSAMLATAGIAAATLDPENGRIERDSEGNPTGTLRESAQGLVGPFLPVPSLEEVVKNLEAGMAYQASNGFTATIDAAIMQDMNEQAYLAMSERADAPLRVRVSLLAAEEMVTSIVNETNVAEVLSGLTERRAEFRARSKGRIDAEAVKIFVDGVPENYTAALLEPYINTPLGPDHRGDLNLSEEALKVYVSALEANDFQVHAHAIGDRAVRASLDAFEAAIAANGPRDRRHHISHLEIVQPEDIARFAPLGVSANLQSLWHFRDAYITDLTEPFLRPELHRWLYPAASFRDAGAQLVWGSDWSVSTSDPFDSIEVAVLRQNPEEDQGETWNEAETLTVADMIRALTINGARLMGQDQFRGSLEVGKRADFIIVDADPYKVAPKALNEITVQATFLDGAEIFRKK